MRIDISELKVIVTLCNPVLWKGRAELVTQREQSTVHRLNVGVEQWNKSFSLSADSEEFPSPTMSHNYVVKPEKPKGIYL